MNNRESPFGDWAKMHIPAVRNHGFFGSAESLFFYEQQTEGDNKKVKTDRRPKTSVSASD